MDDFREHMLPIEARLPTTLFPTMQLRWVVGSEPISDDLSRERRTLQQLWCSAVGDEEWRDIPEVNED